jgi:hypothetical protein
VNSLRDYDKSVAATLPARSWIIDSGASSHYVNSTRGLDNFVPCKNGELGTVNCVR